MPNVQDYMDPTQAAAINSMGPMAGGQPPMPGQPGMEQGGMNPVAQLLAQAADLIMQRQGDPADAAAIEQFLEFLMSLQPGGPQPQQQAPLGQEQGMGTPPPMPMQQGPAPLPAGQSNTVTPLPLPSR